MHIRSTVSGCVLLATVGSATASAQSESSDPTPRVLAPSDLRFEFQPVVWAPAVTGDVELRGSGNDVDIDSLGFDDVQISPAARLSIGTGDFTLRASGFGFQLDEGLRARDDFDIGSISVAAGESFDVEFDLVSVEAIGMWRIWRRDMPRLRGGAPIAMRLDVGGGLRLYDLDAAFTSGSGAGTRSDHTWIEPIAAAAAGVDFGERFDVDLKVTAGGLPLSNTTSSSFDVTIAGRWDFTENVGATLGYRFLSVNLSDGDGADEFSWRGSIAGLFAGVVIRF